MIAITGIPYSSPSSTSFPRLRSVCFSLGAPTKIDIETAVAFSLTRVLHQVVRPSLLRSSWRMLVPPETRRRIGTSHSGSTEFRSIPRVTETTSA